MIVEQNNMDYKATHAIGKSELAMMYFPQAMTPHVALNHLNEMIKSREGLMDELLAIGYKKSAKFFTPKEVNKIIDYLGSPW